jgi:chorismate synthase
MPGNSIGQLFRVTTFGESHGPMIGVVIDGCPAGLELDLDYIKSQMARRKPGQSKITTQRKEDDEVQFVSGVYGGKTTGAPLTGLIMNQGQKEKDYDHLSEVYRPSHADFTYDAKYGHRDHRGGGRSSARETAGRVLAGSIAQLLLNKNQIKITAYVSRVGDIHVTESYEKLDLEKIDENIVRCPDQVIAAQMQKLIEDVRKDGDTVGGIVSCVIKGCPVGLGEPVFDRLHADLGKAMLSINAVKGFEIGSGFRAPHMRGAIHNDIFFSEKGKIRTKTNFSGGIQGGISNGMDIYFNVAFKPVATLMRSQLTVDKKGKDAVIEGKGRHDPCVVPRAVPIVEAMAALTLVDHLLRHRAVHEK